MSRLALRRLVAAVLSVFVMIGLAIYLLVAAYPESHPPVRIPQENRTRFARVAILMDGTGSVGPHNFAIIKQIIQSKIVPSLGVNDIAVAFDVQPTFNTLANEVFGLSQSQMPQDSKTDRARILETLNSNKESSNKTGRVDEDMYELIRELAPRWEAVERVRSAWAGRVESRKPPQLPGSDICGALAEIGSWLSLQDSNADRWLFVLSDLHQEGSKQDCRPSLILADTQIALIYSPGRKEADGFWHPFFGERDIARAPFSALAGGPLLPPNPTAGLEAYDIPTMWECGVSLLGPALLSSGGLIAAIWLNVWRLTRRDRSGLRPPPPASETSGT